MGREPAGSAATVGVAGTGPGRGARERGNAGRAWESEAGDVRRVDRETAAVYGHPEVGSRVCGECERVLSSSLSPPALLSCLC